ncbi:hypothetical protein Tco_0716680 [Tanacetum coccineum]
MDAHDTRKRPFWRIQNLGDTTCKLDVKETRTALQCLQQSRYGALSQFSPEQSHNTKPYRNSHTKQSYTINFNNKLTKNHSLENVIGDPSRPISTRSQLQEHAIWCYFDANDNPNPFGGKRSGWDLLSQRKMTSEQLGSGLRLHQMTSEQLSSGLRLHQMAYVQFCV